MASNKIPGVYSSVDASAALKSISSNQYVIGIIASGTSDDTNIKLTNKAYAPFSFDDAKEKYGSDSNIITLMDTAMENGGTNFIVVRVNDSDSSNPDYAAALAISELEEAIDIVIIDSVNPTIFSTLKDSINNASADRKERTAVIGFAVGTDNATANSNANALNSNRILAAYPNPLDSLGNEISGIYTAAAIAGQLAAEQNPSMPMTGVEIKGFHGLSKKLKITEMESLIDNGVIPLQTLNGVIRIVRCITTYTKNNIGAVDYTWQEVTTVRISDYIFKDLRNRLSSKFQRAKQSQSTRDAVKSEVMTGLLSYQSLEYIENVTSTDVQIVINPINPLVNDVNFKYDVVGPLNIINLTGYLVI
jgi:phage tail sheath gpL-like